MGVLQPCRNYEWRIWNDFYLFYNTDLNLLRKPQEETHSLAIIRSWYTPKDSKCVSVNGRIISNYMNRRGEYEYAEWILPCTVPWRIFVTSVINPQLPDNRDFLLFRIYNTNYSKRPTLTWKLVQQFPVPVRVNQSEFLPLEVPPFVRLSSRFYGSRMAGAGRGNHNNAPLSVVMATNESSELPMTDRMTDCRTPMA
jgi:hypothetical protein